MSVKRLLAVAAAMIASLLLPAVPSAYAAPPPCDGVWVVVQPDEADPASVEAKCATEFGTGAAALASAGFSAEQSGSMLNRIGGLPEDIDFNTNGGYYWSYWSAPVDAEGALGTWEYYQVGADTSTPAEGTAEGWLLTNQQDATGPALTNIADAASEAPADAPIATPAPQPADTAALLAVILGVTAVALAAVGLLVWWFMKGRKR